MVIDVNVLTNSWTIAGVIVSIFVAIGTLSLALIALLSIRSTLNAERDRREFESKQRLLDDLIIMTREVAQLFSDLPPEAGDEINKTSKLLASMAAFMESVTRVKDKLPSRLELPIDMAGTTYSEYLKALNIKGYEPTTIEQGIINETHKKARVCVLIMLTELTVCRIEL